MKLLDSPSFANEATQGWVGAILKNPLELNTFNDRSNASSLVKQFISIKLATVVMWFQKIIIHAHPMEGHG